MNFYDFIAMRNCFLSVQVQMYPQNHAKILNIVFEKKKGDAKRDPTAKELGLLFYHIHFLISLFFFFKCKG